MTGTMQAGNDGTVPDIPKAEADNEMYVLLTFTEDGGTAGISVLDYNTWSFTQRNISESNWWDPVDLQGSAIANVNLVTYPGQPKAILVHITSYGLNPYWGLYRSRRRIRPVASPQSWGQTKYKYSKIWATTPVRLQTTGLHTRLSPPAGNPRSPRREKSKTPLAVIPNGAMPSQGTGQSEKRTSTPTLWYKPRTVPWGSFLMFSSWPRGNPAGFPLGPGMGGTGSTVHAGCQGFPGEEGA